MLHACCRGKAWGFKNIFGHADTYTEQSRQLQGCKTGKQKGSRHWHHAINYTQLCVMSLLLGQETAIALQVKDIRTSTTLQQMLLVKQTENRMGHSTHGTHDTLYLQGRAQRRQPSVVKQTESPWNTQRMGHTTHCTSEAVLKEGSQV